MKKITYIIICLLLTVISCQHEEILLNQPRAEKRSIGEYLETNSAYTLFTYALKKVGLFEQLKSNAAAYTVLAIKNSTYAQEGVINKDDIDKMDVGLLKRQLQYQIITQKLSLADIPKNQYRLKYPTQANRDILVEKANYNFYYEAEFTSFCGAYIINDRSEFNDSGPINQQEGDYLFTNGYVHNIYKPIHLFDSYTAAEYLAADTSYSIFVAGLKKFGYWEKLESSDNVTVFPVSNRFFREIGLSVEGMNDLDTNRFDASLFFGAYIIFDRMMLSSDPIFYFNNQKGQGWITIPVAGNSLYKLIISNNLYVGQGTHIYQSSPMYQMNLGLSKEDVAYGYRIGSEVEDCARFLGQGPLPDDNRPSRYCIPFTTFKMKTDILIKNGVIHELFGLLALPDEAKK